MARWAASLFATGGPSWYTKTVYPLEHAGAIRDAARRYDLDPALVAAVIYAESRFDEHAHSSQGAVGLMQILPETADQIAGESGGVAFTTADLEDPRGQRPLRLLLPAARAGRLRRRPARRDRVVQRRHGRRRRVAGGRRRGAGCASATSRIPETRAYVKKVLEARRVYRETYGERLDGR